MIRIILLLFSLVFSVTILLMGFFDKKGSSMTFILLTLNLVAPITDFFFMLIYGYILVLVATSFRKDEKRRKLAIVKHRYERTYTNIIGKIAVPTLAAMLNQTAFFIASVAYGVSDSFASEIGVLSKEQPRLITTMKKVSHGTNGGVSALGTFASIVGPFLLALSTFFLSVKNFSPVTLFLFAIFAGASGSVLDSLIGEVLENSGKINGWEVNFITSLIVGLVGQLAYSLIIV